MSLPVRRSAWALLAVFAFACRPSSMRAPLAPHPHRLIATPELCAEAGRFERLNDDSFRVRVGGARAVVARTRGDSAEIAFTYRGPSESVVPLANGEARSQIGLKLRAADTCNVVYVMWRLDGSHGVAVSVKRNPGMSTHAACRADGYINVRPARRSAPPALRVGEPHVLRAAIESDTLRAYADETLVWEGKLPQEAFAFDGPAGFRSDNGTFDFSLRVVRGAAAAASCR